MTARHDVKGAIAIVERIDTAGQQTHVSELKWRILGELSLKAQDYDRVQSAIAGLKSLPDDSVLADLLELRRDAQLDTDEEARHTRLRELSAAPSALASILSRYLVAEEMRNQDIPDDAIALLEPVADVQNLSPATRLYLLCLAEARRDEAFQIALAKASAIVREDPEILWLMATHSWNIGDLPASRKAVESLLAREPENAAARLLKIEILIRSDDIVELLPELDRPIEQLSFSRLSDRFRVASLLSHFGHTERAASFAYKLFLENQGNSQAWLTLSGLVLREGMDTAEPTKTWEVTKVSPDSAVDAEYEDGGKLFVVIEPDADLRRLDNVSWEPDHPLVRQMSGLAVGGQFTDPSTGRSATIRQIRHKYVARLHFVLGHHEARFPTVAGFRSLPFDPSQPDGLAPLLEQLKARHDWFEQEQTNYKNGPWPLSLLAHRVGHDTIDTAEGLAAQQLQLKVALGAEPERQAATSAMLENAGTGCVLDLLSFWTCWRLGALDIVTEVGGPIHLPQSAVDQLRARRERISQSVNKGSLSARFDSGKLAVTESSPEVVQSWLGDTDAALQWIQANAIVCPVIALEKHPEVLRDHLRDNRAAIFDALVLAMQKNLLLVSDDLPTRDFGRLFGFLCSTWLHQLFLVAMNRRKIDFDKYVKWTANLIGAGHNYLGVSGAVLIRSAAIDAEAGQCPGYFFGQVSRMIGGAQAEPRSHIRVVIDCLRNLWIEPSMQPYRQQATGMLLLQLIRERTADYKPILRLVMSSFRGLPALFEYMVIWLRGHFLSIT